MKISDEVWEALQKIPGGYVYSGVCSYQICFPLKAGGELRFSTVDEDVAEDGCTDGIDLYGGEVPPGVTGPVEATG